MTQVEHLMYDIFYQFETVLIQKLTMKCEVSRKTEPLSNSCHVEVVLSLVACSQVDYFQDVSRTFSVISYSGKFGSHPVALVFVWPTSTHVRKISKNESVYQETWLSILHLSLAPPKIVIHDPPKGERPIQPFWMESNIPHVHLWI